MKEFQQELRKHPIIAIKDRVGRVSSIDDLSKGQEVEHRSSRQQRYTRARVAGFSDMDLATGRQDTPNVVLNNKVEADHSSSHIPAEAMQNGRHIVRKVSWLRRHLRPIKEYSYERATKLLS